MSDAQVRAVVLGMKMGEELFRGARRNAASIEATRNDSDRCDEGQPIAPGVGGAQDASGGEEDTQ